MPVLIVNIITIFDTEMLYTYKYKPLMTSSTRDNSKSEVIFLFGFACSFVWMCSKIKATIVQVR